jgi:hypothetical protein
MIKVHSDNKLETFQILGPIIRVHWNHEQVEQEEMDNGKRVTWIADEIVVPSDISTEELIKTLEQYNAPVNEIMQEWNK